MQPDYIINQIIGLLEKSQHLKQMLPQHSFGIEPTKILVLSNHHKLASRFINYVERGFRHPFSSTCVNLQKSDQAFPKLNGSNRSINSLWFLSAPDRYEFSSESFGQWADNSREVLGNIPVFGIRVFKRDDLPNWPEPVVVEHEKIAGRDFAIFPLLIYDSNTASHREPNFIYLQLDLIIRLLLQGLRHKLNHRPCGHLVNAWDRSVSEAIDQKIMLLRNGGMRGSNHTDTALLKLLRLDEARAFAKQAANHIEDAINIAAAIDAAYLPSKEIESLAENLAGYIYDMQNGNVALSESPSAPVEAFATDFQRYRNRVLKFTERMISGFKERSLIDEAERFEGALPELLEDIKVILLGPFSSGKSTFLNTLLGLTKSTNSLPTGGKPVTATINVLEYGKQEEAIFKFAKVVDLVLFQEKQSQRGRWKINKEEIRAFLNWLERGEIDESKIKCERFPAPGGQKSSRRKEAYTRKDHELLLEMAHPDLKNTYFNEEWLKDREAIFKISNIRFLRHPKLSDCRDLKACMALVEKPEVALRVEKLTLRRKLEALQAIRFVDTPGTDSLMSHHHTLAKRYIEKFSKSPIIYLVNGRQPASEEDARNIAFLKGLKPDIARLFFTITKKRLIVEEEADEIEIRDSVNRRLKDAGIIGKRVYFIDSEDAVQNPEEAEWKELDRDLRSYVDKNKTVLLRGYATNNLRQPLENLILDYRNLLNRLRGNKEELAQQAAKWTETDAEISKVMKNFEIEIEKARDRLFRRASGIFQQELSEIDDQFTNFDCVAYRTKKKDEKLRQIQEILSPLESWSKELKSNLEKANKVLHSYLKDELSRRAASLSPSISCKSLPSEFKALVLTDINEKAKEDVDYVIKTYTGWLSSKVSRLSELLRNERALATFKVNTEFDAMADYYRNQNSALKARAKEFARSATDTANTLKEIKEKEEIIRFLESGLKQFDAIK